MTKIKSENHFSLRIALKCRIKNVFCFFVPSCLRGDEFFRLQNQSVRSVQSAVCFF